MPEFDASIKQDLRSADKKKRLSALTRIWADRLGDHMDEVKNMLRDDPDPEIRARSAWVLDVFSDMSAKDVLLTALYDHDGAVRSNAGWALVHLGRDVAEDVSRVLQTSDSDETREMAQMILQRI
jgi:HEAT repeat protein